MLGDLDAKREAEEEAADKKLLKSPVDTMDVNWWKFHMSRGTKQQDNHKPKKQTSNRSLPVTSSNTSSGKSGRLQSRLGKNLAF